MKQCTKCKQTKSPAEFRKHCRFRDGLDSRCKVCCIEASKKRPRIKHKPDYSAMKQCTKCKQTKAPTEFRKDCSKRSGLDSQCKVCCIAARKYYSKPDYSAMKQCTKCKQTKAPTEFNKDCSRYDGLDSRCKVCCLAANKERNKYKPDYSAMKQCTKCKQTTAPTEFYKNSALRDGLDSKCKACRNAASKMQDRPTYKPDYSAMKQCTKCKQTKSPAEFSKHCRFRDGLQSQCKACRNAASKNRIKYKPDYSAMKQCTKCKQTKAPTEFSKNCEKRDGLKSQCKVCRNAAHKKRKINNREKFEAREREDEDEDGGHKKKRFRESKGEIRLGLSSEQGKKARLKKVITAIIKYAHEEIREVNCFELQHQRDTLLQTNTDLQHQHDRLLQTITKLHHQVPLDSVENKKTRYSYWI